MPRGDWTIDAKEIQERLCISKDFFYENIAKDPRMKAIEISKSQRKSWWLTKEAEKICITIMKEYGF